MTEITFTKASEAMFQALAQNDGNIDRAVIDAMRLYRDDKAFRDAVDADIERDSRENSQLLRLRMEIAVRRVHSDMSGNRRRDDAGEVQPVRTKNASPKASTPRPSAFRSSTAEERAEQRRKLREAYVRAVPSPLDTPEGRAAWENHIKKKRRPRSES